VPATHSGRLLCAMATLVGITLASLITAALGNMMTFNSSEQAALAVIEREVSRIKLREKAATILVLWWKRSNKLRLTRRQEDFDRHTLRREFLEYKLDTMQEVEDLQVLQTPQSFLPSSPLLPPPLPPIVSAFIFPQIQHHKHTC